MHSKIRIIQGRIQSDPPLIIIDRVVSVEKAGEEGGEYEAEEECDADPHLGFAGIVVGLAGISLSLFGGIKILIMLFNAAFRLFPGSTAHYGEI